MFQYEAKQVNATLGLIPIYQDCDLLSYGTVQSGCTYQICGGTFFTLVNTVMNFQVP
jgi:hypothetical protein